MVSLNVFLYVKNRSMSAEFIIVIVQLVIVSDVSKAPVKTNFQRNDTYFYSRNEI